MPDLLKNAAPIFLALVVTAGFYFFIYRLMLPGEIAKENMTQLNILLGGIAVVWAKAIGFFYDSSASSKEKDTVIGDIAKSAPIGTGSGDRATDIPAKDVSVKAEGDVTITKEKPHA